MTPFQCNKCGAINIGKYYLHPDEEPDCQHFKDLGNLGCINVCVGNEPYSCHRAKKENLCHKEIY